jgi:hypothetical protein
VADKYMGALVCAGDMMLLPIFISFILQKGSSEQVVSVAFRVPFVELASSASFPVLPASGSTINLFRHHSHL